MVKLDPRLAQDCIYLGKLDLCQLLLVNDSQYPWCILVPDREKISELYELSDEDQLLLCRESSYLAACMMEVFSGDKMNIAAIGNIVPQLHVHHIVRYRSDAVWPSPVWGKLPAQAYSVMELASTIQKLQAQLSDRVVWSNEI